MASPRPVVSLSDVSLVLDGKRVLSRVTWKVMPGENWVVLGPNGAGKTSLLSIIDGYRWPSSGSVSVLGRRFGEADLARAEDRDRAGELLPRLDDPRGREGHRPRGERQVRLDQGVAQGPSERRRGRRNPSLRAMGCLRARREGRLGALAGGEAEGRDRAGR